MSPLTERVLFLYLILGILLFALLLSASLLRFLGGNPIAS